MNCLPKQTEIVANKENHMKRIILTAPVTLTAPANGSPVDVSTLVDTSLTLVVDITAMGPDTEARFSVQTSADGFTTVQDGPVVSAFGGVSKSACIRFSFRLDRDLPDFAAGIYGTQARLALTRLTGTSPTVSIQSYFDMASA
jgi:hypothetical protein